MKVTHRRFNIAQAMKIAGKDWCTITDLRCGGAYGSAESIHRAVRRMMIKEDAAAMIRRRDGWYYRITPLGYALLGMVADKKDQPHGRDNTEEEAGIQHRD